jgi:hypothetical protein
MNSNKKVFASSGSCFDDELVINGTVDNITFKSSQFSGIMNSQKFWDDLSSFAKSIKKFVILKYNA